MFQKCNCAESLNLRAGLGDGQSDSYDDSYCAEFFEMGVSLEDAGNRCNAIYEEMGARVAVPDAAFNLAPNMPATWHLEQMQYAQGLQDAGFVFDDVSAPEYLATYLPSAPAPAPSAPAPAPFLDIQNEPRDYVGPVFVPPSSMPAPAPSIFAPPAPAPAPAPFFAPAPAPAPFFAPAPAPAPFFAPAPAPALAPAPAAGSGSTGGGSGAVFARPAPAPVYKENSGDFFGQIIPPPDREFLTGEKKSPIPFALLATLALALVTR